MTNEIENITDGLLPEDVDEHLKSIVDLLDIFGRMAEKPYNFGYILPGDSEIYERIKGDEYDKLIKSDFESLNTKDKADRIRFLHITTYYVASLKQHLTSYQFGSRHAVCTFAKNAAKDFRCKNFLIAYTSLRGLIETTAHFNSVVTKTTDFLNNEKVPSHQDLDPSDSYSKYLGKLLLLLNVEINSDRFKWARAYRAKTVLMTKKQRNRKTLKEREFDGENLEFESIMSAINKLDKEINGTRSAYDLLCDFVHPNKSQRGLYVDHIKKEVIEDTGLILNYYGLNGKSLTSQTRWTVSWELLMCITELLEKYQKLDDTLIRSLKVLNKHTQQFIRHMVKATFIFCPSDICPCGSTKTISKCCGKRLKQYMLKESDRSQLLTQ